MQRPLWVFAGTCAVALAAEWCLPAIQAAPGHHVAAVVVRLPPAAQPARRDLSAETAAVLARPVFAQTRRPPPSFGTAQSVSKDGLPRLAGIVLAPEYRRATFAPEGKPAVSLAEDAAIGGWRLDRIEAARVRLTKGGDFLVLMPSFLSGTRPPQAVLATIDRWTTPAAHGLLRARWANPQLQP